VQDHPVQNLWADGMLGIVPSPIVPNHVHPPARSMPTRKIGPREAVADSQPARIQRGPGWITHDTNKLSAAALKRQRQNEYAQKLKARSKHNYQTHRVMPVYATPVRAPDVASNATPVPPVTSRSDKGRIMAAASRAKERLETVVGGAASGPLVPRRLSDVLVAASPVIPLPVDDCSSELQDGVTGA
jgi:hypothetical protein